MTKSTLYPRSIQRRLVEALQDSPVVLIHGPRQCGKSTLAQVTCTPTNFLRDSANSVWQSQSIEHFRDYSYFTFDDPVTRESAQRDPIGFVDSLPDRVILDEIQRVHDLFEVIKMSVDRKRVPGRFLLTGSTNVLLIPQLSESLAGRMEIVPLFPLAQYELSSNSDPSCLDAGFLVNLFGTGFSTCRFNRLGKELIERIVTGGYPAVFDRPTERRKADWYQNYAEALVQQDIRDLSQVQSFDMLPKLLRAAATQTGQIYNLSKLASPFRLSRPTIGDYITLLGRIFLVEQLPAWHGNRLKRLVKSPKLHIADTGLANALLGTDTAALERDRILLGHLLETFVYQELRKQASWQEMQTEFFHFRDKDGYETDIVIQQSSGSVAGVEVKASATVKWEDFRGLRKLQKLVGDRFVRGVVLYDGDASLPFGKHFHAVPISRLWKTDQPIQTHKTGDD
ncbi:MAG: ATP-binding protein [Rhodobacteraceae bacterium]|nr:ATP-binding protein [Paracoccaceae bacterium]MCY4251386.1 ATP-binding protein [Paracoccaceae bacterium]MCY4307863.1 ATP-binding protein [Paracoccaceae bacterium]